MKIVAVSFSDADGLTKTRQLCGAILGVLEKGDVGVTKKVVSSISKSSARRFRKLSDGRKTEGLPAIYLLGAPVQRKRILFGLPVESKNNVWYEHSDSDTVFAFVHGIFSSSASCWMNTEANVFWPDLVRLDPRLEQPAVFLGGYYTGVASDKYDLDNCEYELFSALKRPLGDPVLPPVLDRKKIVLICHSTGGIVARYMLERR